MSRCPFIAWASSASRARADQIFRDAVRWIHTRDRTGDAKEAVVDWLETQLHQITEMGYERYLTLQVQGQNE